MYYTCLMPPQDQHWHNIILYACFDYFSMIQSVHVYSYYRATETFLTTTVLSTEVDSYEVKMFVLISILSHDRFMIAIIYIVSCAFCYDNIVCLFYGMLQHSI